MLKAARESAQEEAASNNVIQTEVSAQESTEPWWADLQVESDVWSGTVQFIPIPVAQDNEIQHFDVIPPVNNIPNLPMVQFPISQVSTAPSTYKKERRQVVRPYVTWATCTLKSRFKNTSNDPLHVD
ncbi:unnamed protein product [Cuscuta campestris]|uniref:Uncharacterized protein n=1 Tax=Cuscuta campestris TaxID=132261 RepID=A0A484LEA6_9ASTE|nr:unnamed protein product [Cuscuta campestris]